jgi:hypothetical protein
MSLSGDFSTEYYLFFNQIALASGFREQVKSSARNLSGCAGLASRSRKTRDRNAQAGDDS